MVRHRIVQKPITLTTGLTPFFLYSTLNSGTLTPPVPPTNQSSTVRNPGISLTWTRREVPPICGAHLGQLEIPEYHSRGQDVKYHRSVEHILDTLAEDVTGRGPCFPPLRQDPRPVSLPSSHQPHDGFC